MIPKLDEICDCCGGYDSLRILQLFDDKCFKIVEGTDTTTVMCLKDFAYLSENHVCNGMVIPAGEEVTLFETDLVSPSSELIEGKTYARAIMLKIKYPTEDNTGAELKLKDKTVRLAVTNSEGTETDYPLHTLFMWFANPVSDNADDLINKIKLINPNTNYEISFESIVIYNKVPEE